MKNNTAGSTSSKHNFKILFFIWSNFVWGRVNSNVNNYDIKYGLLSIPFTQPGVW